MLEIIIKPTLQRPITATIIHSTRMNLAAIRLQIHKIFLKANNHKEKTILRPEATNRSTIKVGSKTTDNITIKTKTILIGSTIIKQIDRGIRTNEETLSKIESKG